MAKYDAPSDPYIDPTTGVMRNMLGQTTESGLERAETLHAARGSASWQREPGAATYDLKHLQAIHVQLFGKVYDWAGELRTVSIQKGNSQFALPQYIEPAGKPIFKELNAERDALASLPADAFAKRAAHYMGELNALHPFREGNGRTQREFIGQLAHESGHHIRWAGINQKVMTEASIDAMHGDTRRLEKLLTRNLTEYGKEGMTMASINVVKAGQHESGQQATMANPIWQFGGPSGGKVEGVVIGINDKNITYAVDNGTRMIQQKRESIEGLDDLKQGQMIQVSLDRAWVSNRPEYTGKVIEKPQISEAKIQEIVNRGEEAIRASLSGIRDERIVGAVAIDRERLDLVERSFAKDHPKQESVGRARIMLEAIELADIEKRKELELGSDKVESIQPSALRDRQLDALQMVERSLKAGENAGIHIRHELREEWNKEASTLQHSNDGMEHGGLSCLVSLQS